MIHGDIDVNTSDTTIVVTTSVFLHVAYDDPKTSLWGRRGNRTQQVVFFDAPLMRMSNLINNWGMRVEVWSYDDDEIAEMAASTLLSRRVDFALFERITDVEAAAFVVHNTASIQRVFDTDPERVRRYGVRGVLVHPGDDFWTSGV